MKKYENMVKYQTNESKEKIALAKKVIDEAVEEECRLSITDLAKRTGWTNEKNLSEKRRSPNKSGVSVSFFYHNKDVREYYEAAKAKQEGKVLFDRKKGIIDESLVVQNKALMEKVKDLTEKLAKAEGEINKRRNKDREDMIKQYKQL